MTHMNSSNSNDVPSDAPHDIEGVSRVPVTTDEPYLKEIFDSGYVNKAPDFATADNGSGPVGLATANDGSEPAGFATAGFPMAVQTSVSPVLNMDDLQVVFTTNNDPHKWICCG